MCQQELYIANTPISVAHKPYIIAELSGNHAQDKNLALKMVEAAAESGADAVKLQTYTADSMTLDCREKDFVINDKNSLWDGESLYQLYQKACTPYAWHKEIFDYANSLGMHAFSSPFDAHAVEFLQSLDVPCYKIASFEMTDIPLLKKVGQTNKPVIVSTGMASLAEIEMAVNTLKQQGCKDIILLKCTSTYPASASDTNLSTIAVMAQSFGCHVGLSDHTQGIGVAVASVALGARVIEKHFVLDRQAGGVDAAFSLEPQEFKLLVDECNRAFDALGNPIFGGTKNEQKSKQFRRSIYVSNAIKQGDTFTQQNIRVVRPGYGLAPKYYEDILGKTASRDMEIGTALSWECIS